MNKSTANKLLKSTIKDGCIEIQSGVFLQTQKSIIADQKDWDDEDESKDKDFSTCPFWIITDDGVEPEGVSDADDLIKMLS